MSIGSVTELKAKTVAPQAMQTKAKKASGCIRFVCTFLTCLYVITPQNYFK